MDVFLKFTLMDNKRLSFPIDSFQLVKLKEVEEGGVFGTEIVFREKEFASYFRIQREVWSDSKTITVRENLDDALNSILDAKANLPEIQTDGGEQQLKNALKEIWSSAVDLAQVDHEKGQEYISLENLQELIQEVEPE